MIFTAALAFLSLAAADQPKPKWDMTTFTLVLVRPGDRVAKSPAPQDTQDTMEKGHRALLRELAKRGKVVVWGPIEGSPDLLEVIVLDLPKAEDARPLLADDPWFRSGQRVPETHPWFAARGILRSVDPGAPKTAITFGLLRRPQDAPRFPEEKLEEIQKGHMANIEAMAATGDLAIAGPLGDDGTLRGVFVFRGTDEEHLREIASPDTAIQAGRLVLDLHRWLVPEGTLPRR